MTSYRDKFHASENRAHYQNIATKILREMSALRSSIESSPNTPRRWVWELLQNAKDVHAGGGVKIEILLKEISGKKCLIFRHDGLPFTADNIRFLIEQISSKDREKDEGGKQKQTGKFGTGFLATHMLSEKVVLRGIAKEDGLDYRMFKLHLDRSGYKIPDIIAAVEKSKGEVENLDDLEPYIEYNPSQFNTTFLYPLTDNLSREVANLGLADLKTNLPYTLCFVEEISSVAVQPDMLSFQVNTTKQLVSEPDLKEVNIVCNSGETIVKQVDVIILSEGFTSIALPITKNTGSVSLLSIEPNVPKIFCDFPLIGTEAFPFPAIINNPNLNPTDPRDGIYLTEGGRPNPPADENKEVISQATRLYLKLVDYAIDNEWGNLHLLTKLGLSKSIGQGNTLPEWYSTLVTKPIRTKLLTANIVRTADGALKPMIGDNGKPYVWFPSSNSKEIRARIWEIAYDWFPHALPEKEKVEFWSNATWPEWGKLTLATLADFIDQKGNLTKLAESLTGVEPVEWLNKYYKLIQQDENEGTLIMNSKAIVPNQNGEFVKKSLLFMQSEKIDPTFKDIMKLFQKDVRSKIANENVAIEFEKQNIYGQADIVKEIILEVTEKTQDRDVASSYRPALRLLLNYFSNKPEQARSQFPTIYRNKHILYDDDEIMDNIAKAEELKDLLQVFNVSSADELRQKFEKPNSGGSSLLPITEEILISMGITDVDEWEDAMKDTDLKALFEHRSMPTKDMFVFAQGHIANARKRVLAHLRTLDDYNLDNVDITTATTVLAGIKKHGRTISIVFRPAYKKEVIIYYGAERDHLDYADSELWVDDGNEVWQVTLGHIIKTSDIKKFPV